VIKTFLQKKKVIKTTNVHGSCLQHVNANQIACRNNQNNHVPLSSVNQ